MSRVTIDEARTLLKQVMRERFKDTTFTDYIDNRLAGDFAVEIYEAIKHYRQALNDVTGCVKDAVSGSDAYERACDIVDTAFVPRQD